MSTFLHDLALAHQTHEGWLEGSISRRHNNPGNLRWHPSHAAFGGVKAPGFTKFPSYEAGFRALMADLSAKITGQSKHIDYAKSPTLLTYIRVYAPREDGNDPNGYAQAVVRFMQKRGWQIDIDTPLATLSQLILGKAPKSPPKPRPVRSLQRGAKRKAEDSPEPRRSRILKRLAKGK